MMQQKEHPLEVLLTGLHEIEASMHHQQIPKRVILLMGHTKAGKTTLYYYLLGKKLIWQKNQLDVWQMRPQANYFIAYVGNGYDSTTVYPNIPSRQAENQAMIIDMPGFDDNRHHFRLLNIYILLQILKLIDEVHICHVIPEECCESDALMREFQKIGDIFNKQILLTPQCMSFVITKVQNADIKEVFQNQIDDLIQSQLMSPLQNELKAFKEKNIYEFLNENPSVEKGIQLKERIQKQNNFYGVSRHPGAVLSESYSNQIIGSNNIEQFIQYLIQLSEDIKNITEILIQLYYNIVQLQFHEVIASALRIEQSQFLQQTIQSLKVNTSKIHIFKFNEIQIRTNPRKQLKKEHFMCLFKCFQKNGKQKQDEGYLCSILFHFGNTIQLIRKNEPYLEDEYLLKIQNFLKQISSLIFILAQIKLPKVSQKLEAVTKCERLFQQVDKIYKFWQENYQSILGTKQFHRYSRNTQIMELFGELNTTEEEQIIQKIQKLNQARKKKQINDIISKNRLKISKNVQPHHYQDISHALQHAEQFDRLLKRLPISYESLKYLKNQYDGLVNTSQKWVIKKILNKMSQIFYWFSFFEQAIMFKMAIADQNGIIYLLEEGMESEQISIDFARTILIPYYFKVNISRRQLQVCFNYISHQSESPNQQLKIQVERTELLNELLSYHEQCYLLLDNYKQLEPYYINPIMQDFEYYLQQIERKQLLFFRSPIASLTGFINKKMKQ